MNNYLKNSGIILFVLAMCFSAGINAQQSRNLAELLGYPKDAKLLIIHADDMGLAQSVNAACVKAFANKGITSGSIMVPCPWADQMIDITLKNPSMDVGIHLTMTAEWELFRWDGVVSSDQISSLLDDKGYFHPSVEALGREVKTEEAVKEMRAQIDKVIRSGIKPTHIDTHMGSVMATPELTGAYLALSEEYKLPILFPRSFLPMLPAEYSGKLESAPYLLDNMFMVSPEMLTGKWEEPYMKAIREMKPGLNQMIVHIGFDNEELKAVCEGHKDYGSEWRENDLRLVMSREFQEALKSNNIITIGWGRIRDLMQNSGN